jgi:hypothetical protein
MSANGRKTREEGGVKLLEPLLYAASTNVKWSGGYDVVPTAQQEGIDAAEFNWKELLGSVSISMREKAQNNSRFEILNLFESKTKQLTMTLDNEVSSQLFGDGTGEDNKVITGLQAIVNNTGTLGNIPRSSNSWWQAYVESTTKALDEDDMTTAWIAVSRAVTKPSIIVCHPDIWKAYEAMVRPAYRTNDPKLGALGFDTLQYKGIPVVYDHACTAGRMYFINDEFLKLRVHQDHDFNVYDAERPVNQTVEITLVHWMGNMTCGNCRFQGVLTNRS